MNMTFGGLSILLLNDGANVNAIFLTSHMTLLLNNLEKREYSQKKSQDIALHFQLL